MSVNDEENNDEGPSPAERSDALQIIKKFAYEGYMKEAGTDEGFEQLWRTAFNVENTKPNPPTASINPESDESRHEVSSPSKPGKSGFRILPGKEKQQ